MNSAIVIGRVGKDDAEALASLHKKCFSTPWSAESFGALLKNANTLAYAASRRGAEQLLEAYIVTRVAADEAEILTLGTTPRMRRTGLARALVLAAAKELHALGAMEIFLEVAANNVAARELYIGVGFLAAGKRVGYYRDEGTLRDAMILRASLPLER